MEKETIKIKPSWGWAMKALLASLANGSEQGKEIAREELRTLADNVDKANDLLDDVRLNVAVIYGQISDALELGDEDDALAQAEAGLANLKTLKSKLKGGNL